MGSYNRIILVGNLTKDPELKFTEANTAVCKGGIATNRKWRNKDGDEQEEVCFVDFVLFGKPAETFNQYTQRGDNVLIEGRLVFSQWESTEGQKRSKHEVRADNFTFLGARGTKGTESKAPATPNGNPF